MPKRKRDYEQENAARRFRRQAATAERKAKRASNQAEAARYRAQAEHLRAQVKKTYKNPPKGSTVSAENWARQRKRAIAESQVGSLTAKQRRHLQESRILSIGNIASRLFAGTVELWQDVNPADRKQAIFDAFGTDSYMGIMEQLESAGIDIYSDAENPENYSEVSTQIMDYVGRMQDAA